MDRPTAEVQAEIVEALSDVGIAVLVAKGQRFIYANKAAARMAGKTPEEFTAGGSFFDMVAPEERARLQARLRERLAGNLPEVDEIEVKLPDGRQAHIAMAVKLLQEPGSFVVLLRDVTERRLEEARARQAEKMAAVGKLLAGVAHDINTPLAVVLSNLEVTREQIAPRLASGDPLPVDQLGALSKRLDVNHAHLKRIASSIRRLQGLGSPQAPRRVPTDLRPAMLSAVTLARFAAHGRCEVDADVPELGLVACDGEVVTHAVQHLLSNAVEAAKSRVTFRVQTTGGVFEAVVEDDGPGFEPGVVERAFEPFFTTKPAGNMGLGLTLARSIAQDHGGSLTAANRSEGGARLTFRIPLGGP